MKSVNIGKYASHQPFRLKHITHQIRSYWLMNNKFLPPMDIIRLVTFAFTFVTIKPAFSYQLGGHNETRGALNVG